MQYAGSERSHLQHLIISDLLKLSRIADNAGIRCVDTVNIRINLTGIRVQRCSQCDRCRIRTASAERCIIVVLVDPLKTCNDHDLAVFQFMPDPVAVDPFKARIAVLARGVHSHLESIQGNCADAKRSHRHRHHGHRDLFAGHKKHIELTFRRLRVHFMCQ